MAKINLEDVLVGKKMEPRYLEYNWRDIALYNLAIVGLIISSASMEAGSGIH